MALKPSILITINSFHDGGAEMFAIRLANSLANHATVTLLEVEPYSSTKKQQLKFLSKNVKLVQLGKSAFGNYLFRANLSGRLNAALFKIYRSLKKFQINSVLKNEKIQIINSHCWETDVFVSKLNTDVKMIFSIHGHYELLQNKQKDFDNLTKAALQRADKVVFLTKRHLQTLDHYKVPSVKRSRIFYGIDYPVITSETKYNGNEVLSLLLAARGIKEKGWQESIQAFFNIDKKYPGRVKLNLVGEGKFLSELQRKYSHPNLVFHGYQDDVRDFILESHIGLLPTYYIAESLPNSIIEYLFCGKPVITSDIAAIPEMLDAEGVTAGTIVPVNNASISVEAIEHAIEQYILQPQLVEQQSSLAFKASQKFTMEKCTHNYLTLFHSLLGAQATVNDL